MHPLLIQTNEKLFYRMRHGIHPSSSTINGDRSNVRTASCGAGYKKGMYNGAIVSKKE